MAGGGSSSSSTKKETKVVTNTTTNVGDIGFTGDDAVALAEVFQTGIVAQTRTILEELQPITEGIGRAQIVTAEAAKSIAGGDDELGFGGVELGDNLPLLLAGAGMAIAILTAKG